MKKTLTVNLGGTVFNIDDDAYRLLDNYLHNLRQHFRKEAGADEIVDDIERRISELFCEKQTEDLKVITLADVEQVIARIGRPEEMEEDDENRTQAPTGAQNASVSHKRLFRDPDDKILGGVFSGLAAYFGLDTPLLRLVMFVLLLFTGRPLDLTWESANVPAILNVWFGGSETGDAVADVLFGKVSPSGKLTTTFPRSVGQMPLYYSQMATGRPDGDPNTFNRYASNYIDCPNDGLYPFGFGLSYTTFEYGEMRLSVGAKPEDGSVVKGSPITMPKGGTINVTVPVKNTGNCDAAETVQLYIHDKYADIARPVKELKGFSRIFLKKGESRDVTFTISSDELKYYNADLVYKYDAGEFEVMVGPNSRDVQVQSFVAE